MKIKRQSLICSNEIVIINISAPESCFNGLSVAMGVIGASTCIFLVLLIREATGELLGGKDESQGMVGMIKQGKGF